MEAPAARKGAPATPNRDPKDVEAGSGDATPPGGAAGAKATPEGAGALEREKADLLREPDGLEPKGKAMRGTIGLLGKEGGGDPANVPANRARTVLVDSLRKEGHSLASLLRATGPKRSSHFYPVGAMRADRDAGVRELAPGTLDDNDGIHGRRRIRDGTAASPEIDTVIGERRISRVPREGNRVAWGHERRKENRPHDSCAGEIPGNPGNLVKRDFRPGLPDFPWLTGVTQFTMPAGRLCLSPVLDYFDGAIVSRTRGRAGDSVAVRPCERLPQGPGAGVRREPEGVRRAHGLYRANRVG